MERDDPKIKRLPREKAADAPDGLIHHYKDRWWSYDPETDSLLFWKPDKRHPGAPQCNSQEQIARRLQRKLYPWAEVIFMPSVFQPADPRDYL